MTSLVFALLEHHIIMASLCSHHIHIMCMMSSCSHCDVIVFAHESLLQSWCMTDRPSHMIGRPSHDLKAHDHENT